MRDSPTHPILSTLLTHTTSGPPVIKRANTKSEKTSTANPRESIFKFAHPSLYVSKVKSAFSKVLVSVVLFSEDGV